MSMAVPVSVLPSWMSARGTPRHSIQLSHFAPPVGVWGRAALWAGLPAGPGCSLGRAAPWAGLLGVPVGGGPPASRPRRELHSARRLVVRPGPTTAHEHRSQALRTLRRPPHQWGLV